MAPSCFGSVVDIKGSPFTRRTPRVCLSLAGGVWVRGLEEERDVDTVSQPQSVTTSETHSLRVSKPQSLIALESHSSMGGFRFTLVVFVITVKRWFTYSPLHFGHLADFYPQPITISTCVRKKEKKLYISVSTVRMFIEPSAKH